MGEDPILDLLIRDILLRVDPIHWGSPSRRR
jgi:hypothetical protein